MRKLASILSILGRLLGVIQILVGLAMWFGYFRSALRFHTVVGSLFVLVLWILALIALFYLPRRGLAYFALIWGAFVLWFGMAQTTMLVGQGHWAIQLAHLIVGLAAIGLVDSLGRAIKLHQTEKAAAP